MNEFPRPVRARGGEIGVDLIPQSRPFGAGGLADLLAERRHLRRLQRSAAAGR